MRLNIEVYAICIDVCVIPILDPENSKQRLIIRNSRCYIIPIVVVNSIDNQSSYTPPRYVTSKQISRELVEFPRIEQKADSSRQHENPICWPKTPFRVDHCSANLLSCWINLANPSRPKKTRNLSFPNPELAIWWFDEGLKTSYFSASLCVILEISIAQITKIKRIDIERFQYL